MPWREGKYFYSAGVLKAIAAHYVTIYDGLPVSWKTEEYNLLSLAEYRADFDVALRSIGRGKWVGLPVNAKFKDFKKYGRCQRVVIGDILGVDDYELEMSGLFNVPQLRGYAYYLMRTVLNGE
jgi:hypothetical protein